MKRVAILNCGPATLRLMHALREVNVRENRRIETIALHTDEERHALFVRQADHAWSLGPASGYPHSAPCILERALIATWADAVWADRGFIAGAALAERCARIGVAFVQPDLETGPAGGSSAGTTPAVMAGLAAPRLNGRDHRSWLAPGASRPSASDCHRQRSCEAMG